MSCLGECLEAVGPPPDSILSMPPPPAPAFLLPHYPVDVPPNASGCSTFDVWPLCDAAVVAVGGAAVPSAPHDRPPHVLVTGGNFVELPRKDIEAWSGIGDTWLLVVVASSIGVLLLGALLAMFLLKCREMNMFGGTDCSIHRQIKNHEHQRDCSNTMSNMNGSKMMHPTDAVLYHGNASQTFQDNRMVWATLTPRGTQHFISENYPPDLIDYGEPEDHYETIDQVEAVAPPPSYYQSIKVTTPKTPKGHISFENSGFIDYDYEDPENYQLSPEQYQQYGNTDMRCSSLGMRRQVVISRPMVSSPTRIEHPNLPPLNMYPHKGNTLKKNGTLSYRAVDGGTLPKYGL
nr:unnamed protein product [Callosobruchus analis]